MRLPAWLRGAVPAVLVLLGLGALAAEEGPIIKGVEFRGNKVVSTATAMSFVKIRPGDVYTKEAVSADVERLDKSGLFSWVSANREELEGGYKVIFDVTEAATVKEIKFRGNERVRTGALRKFLQQKVGKSVMPYAVKRDVQAIEGYYAKRGFPFTQVRPDTEEVPGGVRLVYEVSEGPRVKVDKVRYEGNTAFPARKVRKAASDEVALLGMEGTRRGFWFFSRGRFNFDSMEAEARAIEDFYRSQGWLDCEAGVKVDFSKDKKRAVVTMMIHEGPLYRVGKVGMEGNKAIDAEEIRKTLSLKEGDPLSTALLERDQEKIADLYGSRGYADARVDFEVPPIVDRKGDVEWKVVEGEEFKIGRVDIYGNYHTKDKVVRRELRFYPGDVYDSGAIERSRARLEGMGYFDRVDITEEQSPTEADAKDVVVNVAEGKTGSLVLSAGVTSNLGFAGSIQLNQRNFDIMDWPKGWRDLLDRDAFVGGGETVSLRIEPGTQYHIYQLSFRDPYLMDTPLTLGLSLYATEFARGKYDEGRLGGEVTLGRHFGKDLLLELGLKRERVTIDHIDADAPTTIFAMEGTNYVNSMSLSATLDRRDRAFMPSSGYQVGGTVELAGEFLGGDVDFLKETVTASFFKTLWETVLGYKHVGSAAFRAGHVAAIGVSEDVPFFERFYLGGQRSLRGFEYRGVGPMENDEPIGGRLIATATMEYEFPLVEDTLRGVFFLDAGNLVAEPQDFSLDEVRLAGGFGLRLRVPFLGPEPISLDFGFPIERQPDDKTQVFSFGLAVGF